MKHPLQSIEASTNSAGNPTYRFTENKLVRILFRTHPNLDMNMLMEIDDSSGDLEQLAQLIGYTVSGFSELTYVSDEAVVKADQACNKLRGEDPLGSATNPYLIPEAIQDVSDANAPQDVIGGAPFESPQSTLAPEQDIAELITAYDLDHLIDQDQQVDEVDETEALDKLVTEPTFTLPVRPTPSIEAAFTPSVDSAALAEHQAATEAAQEAAAEDFPGSHLNLTDRGEGEDWLS